MKKQNDYFKPIEKGTLEDAVQQIWNGDTITEAPDDIELVTLDFDKMSEFKKAIKYIESQGINRYGDGSAPGVWVADRDNYGTSLEIQDIGDSDSVKPKIKNKRDVEKFLKKGKFKLDIRYIGRQ
jgi:hypothetical protein|tara:strand:+ start:288 stop:662 length:375 start_codon:yes stop_codon:yes gene_type:complete